jgi:hypothetical protein
MVEIQSEVRFSGRYFPLSKCMIRIPNLLMILHFSLRPIDSSSLIKFSRSRSFSLPFLSWFTVCSIHWLKSVSYYSVFQSAEVQKLWVLGQEQEAKEKKNRRTSLA